MRVICMVTDPGENIPCLTPFRRIALCIIKRVPRIQAPKVFRGRAKINLVTMSLDFSSATEKLRGY
jgi:hypothetical protein